MYRVGIIVASDKGARGQRADESGVLIRKIMEEYQYEVVETSVLPDEKGVLAQEMMRMSDALRLDLILTTGGTGFSPRDVTPEATAGICDRMAPGIAEAMRAHSMAITPRAMLSRATAGIRGRTLIVNLPGSPKAVRENLDCILDSLPHGLDVLRGDASECARAD